jgi:histidinol phosphatase-like PHP family hydrolase
MAVAEEKTVDLNGTIAALLFDLAAVQRSTQSRWGYKRAGRAVLNLDEPIETYRQRDGTLRKIPHIGPSSTRVILEVLDGGSSPTVERAIAASERAEDVMVKRQLRQHFLSRARVVAALGDARLDGPTLGDYRGDLQMHSIWSDGSQTLDGIVAAGLARGYSFSAVTDHSYGLPIAGGISMAAIREQHREIERLNDLHAGAFRLLKGIEANIRADGSIDMTEDETAELELVVAAPHSALRSVADQTARLIGAVSAPGVHILGHPRGRMYGSRGGIVADWDAVFAAAARARVAIEIDGDPARQDIDYVLAGNALRAGCLFALDSDAHAQDELRYAETAIAHARLARIPRDRIVNCWTVEKLLQWTTSRRRHRGRS